MKKLLIVGLGVLSLSGIAFAGEAMKEKAAQGFAALDADKNGALSQAEIANNAIAAKNFANLDTDKDGSLSKSEFDALHALSQAN